MVRGLVTFLLFCLAGSAALAQSHASASAHLQLFRTESAARLRCPDDNVVWASTASRRLYLAGDKHYAHTHGGFVCEKEARAKGYKGPASHG
jgi:hypothetical protein